MNKNKKISLVIVGIIVLVGVFYGGMVYGKSQIPGRGQGLQAFGQNNARGARNIGGFTSGQIISKDANSITVQLMTGGPGSTTVNGPTSPSQGGSKIIFIDNNTKVSKQTTGTLADLVVGTQISVTGTANADGSVNAQTVQIRPNLAGAVVK